MREAFREQIEKAVHMLVSCAEEGLVRAHSSGSEAIQMTIRLVRIHTDREKIVLQAGPYHGKADQVIPPQNGPLFGMRNVWGIPASARDAVKIVPLNDLDALEQALAEEDAPASSCISTTSTRGSM